MTHDLAEEEDQHVTQREAIESKYVHISKAHSYGQEGSMGDRSAKGTSSVGVGASPECKGGVESGH